MVEDMLIAIQEATGVVHNTEASREQLLRYLNVAGRELWNTADLPGSLKEDFFSIPTCIEEIQLSLPWKCNQIRGVRWATTGQKITIHDIYPRYQATPNHQSWLTWRIRERTPLMRPLSIEGALQFVLQVAQPNPVTFSVTGQSTLAASVTEDITIPAGQLEGKSKVQWSKDNPGGIETISKNKITTCDAIIKDMVGVQVATIGSRMRQASNILIQISDYENSMLYQPDTCVQILYKLPYQELYYDTDVFQSPLAEDALIWRARANWDALSKDQDALIRAQLFADKSKTLIREVVANQESEAEMQVSFAPNQYRNVVPFWNRGGSKFWQTHHRHS